MGIYLNSVSSYTLYKSEVSSAYFVDKSRMLKELIPLAEVGNRHVCDMSSQIWKNGNGKYDRSFFWKGY